MKSAMEKTLTIVVPTYNAERYLKTNLDSFLTEALLDDIEVLVINDGSADHSLDIASEYAHKYPRTYRVISKENGGHGSGINCGIQHARGRYFKVVDADDWVAPDGFAHLVQFLKHSDSDIVYSGFLWAFDHGQASPEEFQKKAEFEAPFTGVIYGKEYRFDDIAEKAYIKMHNLTIKTDILRRNRIRVDEHCFYVDTEYITYPIPFAESICFLKDFVYMYRIGNAGQSVSIQQMQRNEKHYDQVLRSLFSFYSRLGTELPCSLQKKTYVGNIIARTVAGKYKVILSAPACRANQEKLRRFDQDLKKNYPEIYAGNVNKAVWLLRKTNYTAYRIISLLVKKKYAGRGTL